MIPFWKRVISEDGRQHRRLRTHCLIKYSFANDPSAKKRVVTTRNISSSGALFISDLPLPKNALLEAEIYLPPFKNFFTVMASVARVEKIRETDQYWGGIHFTAIDPNEKETINSYIEDLAKHPAMHKFLDKKSKVFKRKYT